MENLPVGYRLEFKPTDEELINYFLDKKLKGENPPHGDVKECDIYGDKEPWKLFDKDTKQKFYVFVKLKKRSKNRIKRTAGCGTWVIKNTEPIEDCRSGRIGSKRTLAFEFPKDLGAEAGRWIMHEYSTSSKRDEYVVCRIRNKDLENKKTSTTSKKMEQEELPLIQPHNYENQIHPQLQSQSIQTQLPIKRLIRAVKSMSPQELSESVAAIHTFVTCEINRQNWAISSSP